MFLEVDHIAKAYQGKTILKDIGIALQEHTTLSILGKSGCGKSTLLKIIAGLEQPDSGTIRLSGIDITDVRPEQRNIVYLFQEALLFPNMNVFENIAFGLRIRKFSAAEIKQKVSALVESLQLTDHLQKMPHELSGGQKQRVAFGRALIINPPLILLDEPFSSLDVETRSTMQQLYKTIAQAFHITALFVTHDLKEALLMGNQFSYMDLGSLQVFENREAFINSDLSDVKKEIAFWNTLKS